MTESGTDEEGSGQHRQAMISAMPGFQNGDSDKISPLYCNFGNQRFVFKFISGSNATNMAPQELQSLTCPLIADSGLFYATVTTRGTAMVRRVPCVL